jgi:hypothetical protein
MKETRSKQYALLLLPLLLLALGGAAATPQTFEYHADARMHYPGGSPLEDAYGYAYVVSDKRGHGVIRVMFSNGTALDRLHFNARVQFIDTDGAIIREEIFAQSIEAADAQGAAEHRISKIVELNEFARVQVDFYLS